ncbi:sec1 family domain-containing 2 [Paramuricea clavata]|uniref:Sec1 family domain-containing 2 n=1 Tax=Paramuricea clavata TaxID=317549 RepID=A0A6S7KB12_PARCT|nr:sec1 family domain-containing 2 [Paramuricea clavata]
MARESIFWPGMNSQIEELVSNSSTSLHHASANQRKPLHPHEIPSRPWQKVGTDLFDWNGKPHLIVVDYYSQYPEVSELRNTKARTVINKTKSIFSRHGIPESVVSDNGPQYSSEEYKQFANDYNFIHNTIGPRYPQSGGLHEKTVQTVKNLLEKCKVANQDPYLALLDYRNTPIDGVTPAQALISRRLRSPLPISQRNLNPKPVNRTTFHAARQQQQQQQRKHYDRTAKCLPPLEKGDTVRFKKDPQAAWTRGTAIRKHEAPRSYVIKGENGTEYRRNRRHLRKTREHQADLDTPDIDDPQDPIPQPTTNAERNNIQIPIAPNLPQLKTSRYGRRINQNPNYKT